MQHANDALSWSATSIRIGRICFFLAIVTSFAPLLYFYLVYNVYPPLDVALTSWLSIAMVFGAFYFVEPFSYYPILGLTGSYLGILSGNISNVRLPASAAAQMAVGVESGSKQAEIISTLGIAGSIFTNLFFLTLAVVMGDWILSVSPPALIEAVKNYILPTIFGCLYGQFTVMKPKIALYALPITAIFYVLVPGLPAYIYIIVAIFGNLLLTRILYKKNIIS
ncbi:hypothetical protein Z042_24820 [Chania multitudinisentens RB-25]|uniref:Uncharacterized protein n=1 Tax=Chania multitudinisentens RB-25 TaxID=1441930 RepID=W0LJ71_9GAMM|nr:hypothetical protein [Chania multitudinisentens]AHG22469.1 hypothetical protein Z042_24820 [Chania multitudinisentens RB-25]